MPQVQPTVFNFDQYLVQSRDTEQRHELTNGVLIEVPPESDDNIALAIALAERLRSVVDWRLLRTHATTIQVPVLPGIPQENRFPDLLVLTPELADQLRGRSSAITLAMANPALVVEVVSPYRSPSDSNYRRDYVEKRQQYQGRGIPEFWIVDPTAARITVLALTATGYQEQRFEGYGAIASPGFPALDLSARSLMDLAQ